ncbi:futalosine hydrolase [Streptomyces abikoensis]|uniref:futalosine hydrolase n=1 Tax=Streptomyces abikoensis TaxID=97398 RepID=UPI0033E0D09F
MRVLVVTAVPAERDAVTAAAPERREFPLPGGAVLHRVVPDGGAVVCDVLAAGVGPAAAAAGAATALTAAALAGDPYDLVVSAGIAGGFAPAAPVGALVVSDALVAADLGAQSGDGGFLSVTELGFGSHTHRAPEELVRAVAGATGAVRGAVLTVSTATGTAERAGELAVRHPGAVAEGMEGFGVAEAAAAHGVPVLELRAVSNEVGPRDKGAWRIGEALRALTGAFGGLFPVFAAFPALPVLGSSSGSSPATLAESLPVQGG